LVDIPGNNTTTATITVGGSTTGALEVSGDHDWYKISLTAGQAITVALNGITLQDPYLRVYDQNGVLVYQNDDINTGVNLNSLLSFAANYTGIYYIDAGSYEDAQTPGPSGGGGGGDRAHGRGDVSVEAGSQSSVTCSPRKRSASMAAMQPVPAAVTAWR